MTTEIVNYLNENLGIDIRDRKRTNEYVFARMIYYKLARELTNLSLERIGQEVDRDHASVIHSLKKFNDALSIPYLEELYNSFLDNPIKEKVDKKQIERINKKQSKDLQQLRNKYKSLLNEKLKRQNSKIGDIENLLKDLNEEQLELAYVRIEAMTTMIKKTKQ